MLPYFILISSILSYASASCGSRPPTDGEFAIITVGQDRGLTTVQNYSNGAIGLAMLSPKADCDASCLYTLEQYGAPHNQSTLIVRKELSELIPLGYTRITNRSTIYCARSNGQCGSTVPIWRHYFLNGTGIYHSYTLNDSSIDGYTRESSPLCFGWSIQTNGLFTSTVKSTQTPQTTISSTQSTRSASSTVSSTITPSTIRSTQTTRNPNSTVSSTSSTLSSTQTTRTASSTISSTITPSTMRSTQTTRISSTKSPSTLTPSALNQIFVRMVESVLGNDPNWRDTVRRSLREFSDIL